MKTRLVEFENQRGDRLRGVLDESGGKDVIVVMLGGFERAASTERKFKLLADGLVGRGVDSFRFDVADVGLSDGDFYQTTTQTMADDLLSAIEAMRGLGYRRVSFAGHSHAGCNLSLLLDIIAFEKILLIAPALNQKELWRLWFVQDRYPDKKIGWYTYRDSLDEHAFEKTFHQEIHTKNHVLSPRIRQVNAGIDYAAYFRGYDLNKVLVVQGDSDQICPAESLTLDFPRKITVAGGDHDVDQPGIISCWIDAATDFLTE